jgi:Zn-dependent protease
VLRADNLFTNLLAAILSQGIILNLVLFFFNLIPLSPLDGWQIVLALLPPNLAYTWQKYQQATYYLFFGLILISLIRLPGLPSPLGILVTQPTIALYRLFLGL